MADAIKPNLSHYSNFSIFLESFTIIPPTVQEVEETPAEDAVPMRSRAKTAHPWDNAVPLRQVDITSYSNAVCMKFLYSKKCPFEYIPYLACELSSILIQNIEIAKANRKPGVPDDIICDRYNLKKINELLSNAMTGEYLGKTVSIYVFSSYSLNPYYTSFIDSV